mgnify:CR=1 FL=1
MKSILWVFPAFYLAGAFTEAEIAFWHWDSFVRYMVAFGSMWIGFVIWSFPRRGGMTTKPSSDDKCREAFEREYFAGAKAHESVRSPLGEYKFIPSQIAWTHFRFGWLAKERAQ